MDEIDLAKKYLKHLEQGEYEKIISMFHPDGTVDSPLYGKKAAVDFFNELKVDTSTSKLLLKEVFKSNHSNSVAVYFNYHWILNDKSEVTFDVVDIIELDSNQKILHLKIIYDTVVSRDLIEKLKK